MKTKILLTLALLSFASFALAAPKPAKCPSLMAVQLGGITNVMNYDGDWYGSNISTYDTTESWGFYVKALKAKNATEARQIANTTLMNLQSPIGPMGDMEWVCDYSNKPLKQYGMAITPPDNTASLAARLK